MIIYAHDSFITRSNLVDVKVAVSLDKFLYSTVLIGHGYHSFQILNARGLPCTLIKPQSQLFYLESLLSVNFDFSQASVSVADLEDAGVAAGPILAN